MRIECTIHRKGGTVVTFDQRSAERLKLPTGRYHFQPLQPADFDSPHVAVVGNAAHRDHLLTIRAFRVFDGAVPEPVQAPALGVATGGSASDNAVAEVKPPAAAEAAFDAAEFQRRSVRGIKDGLSELGADDVRAVLALEQADSDVRQSVVDLCMARLRALES